MTIEDVKGTVEAKGTARPPGRSTQLRCRPFRENDVQSGVASVWFALVATLVPIGVRHIFATYPGKLISSVLSLLGFAVRWVISFAVCLWIYVFTGSLYFGYSMPNPEGFFERVMSAFAVAFGFAFAATTEMVDLGLSCQTYLYLAAVAFVIAFAWGRICRRLCGPAHDWF